MTDSVLVMVRYPVVGRAKTRLAAGIGAEKAAEFYRICARRILREIDSLPAAIGRYIFFADSPDRHSMEDWAGPGFVLREQVGEDLGERLTNAFKEVFSLGTRKAVIIASDVPDFSADIIGRAMVALDSFDLVLGPCLDGGYYLLGMRSAHPELFRDIPWSSAEVKDRTLERAGKLGLASCLLPELIDVDDFEDFKKWLALCCEKDRKISDFVRGLDLS